MKRFSIALAYATAVILILAYLAAGVYVHFGVGQSWPGWLLAGALVLVVVNLFLK